MAYQWIPDVPGGPLRNRFLSSDLRHASVAKTVALQFARPETGYGRRDGDTLTIQRVGNLQVPTSSVLGRNKKVPIDKLAVNTTTVTVSRMGRGIEVDEEVEILAEFDPKNMHQIALTKQLRQVMDAACGVAMKTGLTTYTPTGASTFVIGTDGGATAPIATSNMNVAHVRNIKAHLYDTLLAEPYEDDYYVCLSSYKGLAGVRHDPEYREWRRFLKPDEPFFKGLTGEVEGIRFVETNNKALLGNVGASGVLGEQIYFGADAFVMAEVQSPELRMTVGPHGLQTSIVWIGTLGFGAVWDSSSAAPGEARVVRVMSN